MVGVERAIIELSFDVQLEMIEALLFELQASKVGQQIVKSVFLNDPEKFIFCFSFWALNDRNIFTVTTTPTIHIPLDSGSLDLRKQLKLETLRATVAKL